MRKLFFLSVFMAAILISCGCSQNDEFIPSFDRETFNHERQLWLGQDIQNYSFCIGYVFGCVGSAKTVFVQNGNAKYFCSNLGNTDGTYSLGSLLMTDMDDPNGEKKNIHFPFRLSVSDIYSELERCADLGDVIIDVQYDSISHYPEYFVLRYKEPGSTIYMRIRDFVVDPEIPKE